MSMPAPWLEDQGVRLWLGDSATVLNALPSDSVDLIITSPPYWALRNYGGSETQLGNEETPEAFLVALWKWADACHRVLAPTGVMWVNLGDKYSGSGGHNNSAIAPRSIDRLHRGRLSGATRRSAPDIYLKASGGVMGRSLMMIPQRFTLGAINPAYRLQDATPEPKQWCLRSEVIWSKPNGMPESVTNRPRRSHEHWFMLTKQGAGYCASSPQRYPSVWNIPTFPLRVPEDAQERHGLAEHHAAFPPEWPRRLIPAFCPEGGVVLDPFVGTGTVPMVSRHLGRAGWGIDCNEPYLRLARWRIFESGHWLTDTDARRRVQSLAAAGIEQPALPLSPSKSNQGEPQQ